MSRTIARRAFLSCCATATLTALAGCGYMVGGGFDPQVRSVEVPMFETSSLRRGIEVQLTEAVQKQIQLRTPFRVVKSDADTRLSGRVVDLRKSVLGRIARTTRAAASEPCRRSRLGRPAFWPHPRRAASPRWAGTSLVTVADRIRPGSWPIAGHRHAAVDQPARPAGRQFDGNAVVVASFRRHQ